MFASNITKIDFSVELKNKEMIMMVMLHNSINILNASSKMVKMVLEKGIRTWYLRLYIL